MTKLKRIYGGTMAVFGYLLSPLSWWNDLYVNIPLAYLFAALVGLFIHGYFLATMLIGYWITNVAGFIIMHAGIRIAALKERKKEYLKDFLLSVAYTLLVFFLYYIGWIKFPLAYFKH